MGKTRKAAVVGILASLSMLLAACAPASDGGPTNGAPEPTAGGGTTQPQTNGGAEPTEEGEGKTISFQLYQQATQLDPFHMMHGAEQAAAAAQFLTMLTFVDGEFTPRLAESWETDDNQTYTFKLADAVWSDDTPISGEDVKFTYERLIDPKVGSPHAGYVSMIDGSAALQDGSATDVSGIEVVDPQTVKITLTEPTPAFLGNLTELPIAPKHVYESIPLDSLAGHALFREPEVGSAAYMFSKWLDDDTIEFVKNPKALYPAKAERLILKYLTGDVAVAQLQTGEIDIAEIPATEVDDLKSKGVKIVSHEGNKVMTLHNSLPSGKLKDKRVRQAIMYAIDREAIIDSVLAGKGRTAGSMMFQPEWAQSPDQNDYAYNPDKARELLAEANWDANTEVNLEIIPGQADRDAVFNIIVGQLNEVGIKAVIRQHQAADLTNFVNDYKLDLLISPYTQTVPEPAGLNSRLMCATRIPDGPNIAGWCDEQLDKWLTEGAATVDEAKRTEIYHQVTKYLNEEVVQFPLYVADLNSGTSETIEGFDNRVWPVTAIADHWSK